MKRRSPVPAFAETAAPLIALFPALLKWNDALLSASIAAFIYLALSILFRFFSPAFPKKWITAAFVLTAASAAFALPASGNFHASAALAACMLRVPLYDEGRRTRGLQHDFLKAIGFTALAFYLGCMQQFFGRSLEWPLFQRVCGTFLLLVPPALSWPASRREKSRRQTVKFPAGEMPS